MFIEGIVSDFLLIDKEYMGQQRATIRYVGRLARTMDLEGQTDHSGFRNHQDPHVPACGACHWWTVQ
jgi:hypothetical protein